MVDNKIKDDGDSHKYFSQIPHLIDDAEMSVYAFRLYVHIKRVVGKNGKCWQSTRTLSEKCKMSIGKISQAKDELKSLGLVEIELVKDKKGEHHEITIVDVWLENMMRYSPGEQACSCSEQPCSCDERTRSPGEPKNNPPKNNPPKNEEEEGKPNIFTLYESSIGLLTGDIGNKLKLLEDDYPVMWIEDAFAIAKKKAKHLNYVVAILSDWNLNGKDNGYKPKGKKKGVDEDMYERVAKDLENG